MSHCRRARCIITPHTLANLFKPLVIIHNQRIPPSDHANGCPRLAAGTNEPVRDEHAAETANVTESMQKKLKAMLEASTERRPMNEFITVSAPQRPRGLRVAFCRPPPHQRLGNRCHAGLSAFPDTPNHRGRSESLILHRSKVGGLELLRSGQIP